MHHLGFRAGEAGIKMVLLRLHHEAHAVVDGRRDIAAGGKRISHVASSLGIRSAQRYMIPGCWETASR
jgi:hypothetical protein